jgi:hypothetical protein
MEPPPGVAPDWPAYRADTSLTMLWGLLEMVGARRLARPRLPDSESGGSAIPREPRADEIGVPNQLRSGDLLHERQACWLDYTTATEVVRAERFALST